MKTYVFGHIKPDLDSVVAAISIAEYAKLNGEVNTTPAIVEDVNAETQFVFDKLGLKTPAKISLQDITPEDRVILVDHNEVDQRLVGLNPDQIVGIYDHHKANINFSKPIEICIMPFGSSNTVAWQLFKEINYSLTKEMASLMLCAVISDTVGLKSSTTTDKDRAALEDLAKIAGISDIEGLTLEIFKAKSNISALTPEQIIKNDYKIFEFGKKTFIGQIETVEQEDLLNSRKQELVDAMTKVKQEEGVNLLFLAVTDILKVNTKLLTLGDEEASVAQVAFGGTVADHTLDIGPKMSRKKDIAPAIEKALI